MLGLLNWYHSFLLPKEIVDDIYFVRCKKCKYFFKIHCIFCDFVTYYICIIIMEVRVCTELQSKNY